jgi:methionyl-tRNA formyltransferase
MNAIRRESSVWPDDTMGRMRSVFMGSPAFALPSLEALASLTQVAGVVTQPDRPAGRGRTLVPPPVKELAQKLGLPVYQPETLRSPEALARLRDWRPEIILVAAYRQILRPEVLDLPDRGCVNLHASLLPRHRGASPVAAAILAGDAETGVTLMKMDQGVDTGPILARKKIPILAEDTTESLTRKLAGTAAEILTEHLPVYILGELAAEPQDGSLATYAPQLKKEDGKLDFRRPSEFLHRQVRAFHRWPGTFVLWKGSPLKILEIHPEPYSGELPPGTTLEVSHFPAVRTADGLVVLRLVQPAGKRVLSGDEFLRGARNFPGKELN